MNETCATSMANFLAEIVDYQSRMLQAQIKMTSMVAQNNFEIHMGEYPTYTEKHFLALQEEFGISPNQTPTYKGY